MSSNRFAFEFSCGRYLLHGHEPELRINEEQTAHLLSALLHLTFDHGADPDTNRTAGLHSKTVDITKNATGGKSSFPTAGLTYLLHLQFHVLQNELVAGSARPSLSLGQLV
jgi:hypothetical protein